jgi:hypothetical protein
MPSLLKEAASAIMTLIDAGCDIGTLTIRFEHTRHGLQVTAGAVELECVRPLLEPELRRAKLT